MHRCRLGPSWALWNATLTLPAGCGGSYPWWYVMCKISVSILFTQPQPPFRIVRALLFQWHLRGSVHDCTHLFPKGMDFYGFLVRTLTKPYSAVAPTTHPFLCGYMDFRLGEIRLWKSLWIEVWGLNIFIENYGLSVNICHKEAQLFYFIGISFSSISQRSP